MRGKILLGRSYSLPWPKLFVTQMLTYNLLLVSNFDVLYSIAFTPLAYFHDIANLRFDCDFREFAKQALDFRHI